MHLQSSQVAQVLPVFPTWPRTPQNKTKFSLLLFNRSLFNHFHRYHSYNHHLVTIIIAVFLFQFFLGLKIRWAPDPTTLWSAACRKLPAAAGWNWPAGPSESWLRRQPAHTAWFPPRGPRPGTAQRSAVGGPAPRCEPGPLPWTCRTKAPAVPAATCRGKQREG